MMEMKTIPRVFCDLYRCSRGYRLCETCLIRLARPLVRLEVGVAGTRSDRELHARERTAAALRGGGGEDAEPFG